MSQRPQRPLSRLDPRAPTNKRQGLTPLEVEAIFAEQQGRCALGGEPLGPDYVVDHDHLLAAVHSHSSRVGCALDVRGLLCRAHNGALGVFHDDPDELRRAAAYIVRRRP